ncbi:MAG: hypothetical protein GX801_09785 [Fibrobacter sp.]|nr:hypothetical protein [Fibrobacter sp.]
MEIEEKIDKVMQSMLGEFPELVRNLFQDTLGLEIEEIDSEKWSIVPRLSMKQEHSMNMGLSNDDWSSLLAMSFSAEMFNLIPGVDGDIELARSGLGEVLNGMGGVLAGNSTIIDAFQELTQAPPMYYANEVLYPKTSSIQGVLVCQGETIDFGWACRSTISPMMRRMLERNKQ